MLFISLRPLAMHTCAFFTPLVDFQLVAGVNIIVANEAGGFKYVYGSGEGLDLYEYIFMLDVPFCYFLGILDCHDQPPIKYEVDLFGLAQGQLDLAHSNAFNFIFTYFLVVSEVFLVEREVNQSLRIPINYTLLSQFGLRFKELMFLVEHEVN